jgi:DNA-binding XRE family transcriptional regulator
MKKKKLPDFKNEKEFTQFVDSHNMAPYLDDMEPVDKMLLDPKLAQKIKERSMKRLITRHEDRKKELLKDPEIRKAYKEELSLLKNMKTPIANCSKKLPWGKDPNFRKVFEEADIKVRIAVQIALARGRAHMSQVQLARKLGIKLQTVSRIERGGQDLTLHTLWKIARAVKCKLVIEFRPLIGRRAISG